MANTIQIKRRTTSGTPSGLAAGELAVNLSDDKLYVGNAAGNGVIHLNPSASTSYLPLTGGTLTGDLTSSGVVTLSSSNPRINLTDTDTNCDSFISANSGAGGLSISADVNDEGSGAFVDLKTGNASRLILRGTGSHDLTGALTVSGNVSSEYVAIIDNDQANAGHGLKVTSDGNGAGSNILEVESGSTSLLRVTGDGKATFSGHVGIGVGPSKQLHIKDSGSAGLRIESTSNSARDYDFHTDGHEVYIEGVGGSSGSFQVGENGTFPFRVDLGTGALEAASGKFTTTNNQVTIFSGGTQYGYWNQNIVGFKNAAGVVRTDSTTDLKLQTNSTDRLSIDGSTGTATFSGLVTIDQNANATSLKIDSESTTDQVIEIDTPQTTTASILDINDCNFLTTGKIAYFRSNSADTSARSLVEIVNDHASATGTTALKIVQDSTGYALDVGGAATFSGAVSGTTATLAGTGLANAPTLAIDNSSSNTYIHSLEAFTANITSGQTNILVVGKEGSTKNAGYIGYKWSGAGSDANLLTLGHWGANHLLTISGAGAATFSNDVTVQGDTYIYNNKALNVLDSGGQRSLMITNHSSGSNSPYFSADPDNQAANTKMYWYIDGAEKMSLDAGGSLHAQGTVTASGNLTVEGNSTLGNATGDTTTISGALTVGGNITTNGSQFYFYRAVNSGNPEFHIGSAAAERLTIQSVYASGAQTLSYVAFRTFSSLGAANAGQMNFYVDNSSTEILKIQDSGIATLALTATTGTFSGDVTVGATLNLGADCSLGRVGANILRTYDRLDVSHSDGVLTNRLGHYTTAVLNIGSGHDVNINGDVGIGETSPSFPLHVKAAAHMQFCIQDSVATMRFGADDDVMIGIGMHNNTLGQTAGDVFFGRHKPGVSGIINGLQFSHYNGSSWVHDVRIDDAGNVGIGTASPSEKLTILGGVASPATSGTGANGNFAIESSNSNSLYFGSYLSSPYGCWIQVSDLSNHALTYPLILQPNGGNVGIGINAPTTTLDVYHATHSQLTVSSPGNQDSSLSLIERTSDYPFGSSNVYGFQWKYDGGDNKLYLSSGVDTTVVNRLTVQRDDGRVGINHDNPREKLDVISTIRVSRDTSDNEYLNIGPATDAGLPIKWVEDTTDASNGYGKISFETNASPNATYPSRGGFSFGKTGDDPFLLIANTGRVGIGTTDPKAQFHVHEATDANLQISCGVASEARFLSVNDADNAYKAMKFYGSRFEFLTGGVGINTASPGSYKLYVNGTTLLKNAVECDDTLDVGNNVTIDGIVGMGGSPISGYRLYSEGHNRLTGHVDVAVNSNTNLRVNGATHSGETWDGAIHIKNSSTIGNETADEAVIYAEGGELKCMDDDRNRTTLSSHEDGKWCYKSDNTKTGRSVVIRMEDLVKAVEEHLGVSFSEIIEGNNNE